MKRIKYLNFTIVGILFFAIFLFTNCNNNDDDDVSEVDDTIVEVEEGDEDYIWDSSSEVYITLNGDSITVDGEGASASDSKVFITQAGNYKITGTLNDGQIIVNTEDENLVRLILNGINITNTTSAPINIIDAEKTIVILLEDTTNYLTDTSNYIFEGDEDEPNATLFSDDEIAIHGEGTLVIDANYNDGIASKEGLIIDSGTITINAVDDAIRGKDYVQIDDGNITIVAQGDGIKSDNDEDPGFGFVVIEDGQFNITALGNGIIAESNVEITYGDFTIETGGGYTNYNGSNDPAKGIKAYIDITIEDGIFNIDSADDNINASYDIVINSGTFVLASGDDSVHSDVSIEINGGDISITDAVEGIESPSITINSGDFIINTSDDAINAAGDTTNNLYINGGYLVIDCSGDGLDSNGNLTMTDGLVILNGPTAQNNSPLDCDGTLRLDGGFLVATGFASNMDEAGSSSSSQYSLLVKLSSSQSAGNLFHLENSSGENILTFEPAKTYKSVVFSSPELSTGNYNIYLGGSSTGTETDGLYEDGTYTPGTLYESFSISSITTIVD